MQQDTPTYTYHLAGSRLSATSPLGLAAMATILHVAIFAGRVSPRRLPGGPQMLQIWQEPTENQIQDGCAEAKVPSNPIHTYCAGHLALASGMAVIVLATWLQIMHISGSLGR